jgi:transposase
VACPTIVRFKLDRLLSMASFAREQVRQTTRELRRYCKEEAQLVSALELLCSVPGVGAITATHLMARVGDGSFISNLHQLQAFLGLVPCESSTGDNVHKGAITHAGDGRLRAKLIQAGWVAIRKDPELRRFYERIYQRHPVAMASKKAITAVAAKLCRRIAWVLKNQQPYVVQKASDTTEKEQTAMSQGIPRSTTETSVHCVA